MRQLIIICLCILYAPSMYAVAHGEKERWCSSVAEEIGTCKNPKLHPEPCQPQNQCKAGKLYCCEWNITPKYR